MVLILIDTYSDANLFLMMDLDKKEITELHIYIYIVSQYYILIDTG